MPRDIRWGILSTANIGRAFINGVAKSRVGTSYAVSSREWTRAVEMAKEHGIPRFFGSYDEMLKSGEIDAVYNPLPNSLHAEWTIKALEAGYPVLCEKPMAANAQETARMAETARQKKLLLAEAFQYRYHPIYDRVRELLDAGEIGEVVSLRAVFNFQLTHPETNIRASDELAGGALMDVGCYCVSFCRLVLNREPESVCAIQRGAPVDQTLVGLLRFPNDIVAEISASMESNFRNRAEIVGRKGILVLESFSNHGGPARLLVRHGEQVEREIAVPEVDCYHLQVEDFATAVKRGGHTRWGSEDAVANMRVIDALYQAARTGRQVDVPQD